VRRNDQNLLIYQSVLVVPHPYWRTLGMVPWHCTQSERTDHTICLHPLVILCTNKDEALLGLTNIYLQILVTPHTDPDDGDRASLRNVGF
jgi:hypothetical protein